MIKEGLMGVGKEVERSIQIISLAYKFEATSGGCGQIFF